MIIKHNNENITKYVTSAVWSGAATQAARTLEINILNTPHDKNISNINIMLGDILKLYDENKKGLFYGMVYSRERLSDGDTLTINAYDVVNHLLRSTATYYFKNTTPEKIVTNICNDLQLKIGSIAATKVPIAKMIFDGESFYNMAVKAYRQAYKQNKKRYMVVAEWDKISVIEKGATVVDFELAEKKNIISAKYSEDLEEMINKVKIYDDKKKQIGEVQNAADIKKYGIFQSNYTKQEKINETIAAKNILEGVSKTSSVDAIGNTQCIAGKSIKIKDSASGLTGKFWIESDTHTWEDGKYTMSLDLNFKNLMEKI